MYSTWVVGKGWGRDLDSLDLFLAGIIVACATGGTLDGLETSSRDGFQVMELSEENRRQLLGAQNDDDFVDAWLEMACSMLVELTLPKLGSVWHPECELGIEILLCDRAEILPELALLAGSGPLVAADVPVEDVVARQVPYASLARLIV